MVPGDRQPLGTLGELASRSRHQRTLYGMGRRPKTQAELHADLQIFEVAWKREMAHFMRNAVERMITPGSGRRMPAKYKMKLPRFTTTVLESSLNPGVAASAARRPSELPHAISRRHTRKKRSRTQVKTAV